ncbi:amidase [Kitasatospora sp. MAP5-34]|uniref:amidase n=1 Tax=Kitasatospora sp. MAP5-34 TaxID=3035102 RepID=UPI002477042F|nr:amidase [Kitasatospora sp. MAP5-34]MDH6579062.1 amidase [Kitasatospora sp. MAP5-34]
MHGTGELRGLDGLAQAELIAKGELTERELTEAAIERIESYDGSVNAVVIPHFEQALAELAELALAGRPEGRTTGPLHGVPFLLKDLGPSAAGIEATLGSAFMAGYTPSAGSELVARFRRAGLRVLGKTNSAEFGVLPTTEPRFHGATRNPWDLTRSAGGSSGGSAAAVAAGLVPVAHANDAGGSIRIPAAACGVFGLKPTRARTPLGPSVGDLMNGLASEHVVTRSVRDSAAVLDAVAGPSIGDPYWAPPAGPDSYLSATLRDPARPLRIAVSTAPAVGPVDPECVAAVERTARLCAELGHQVVWTEPTVGFADLVDPFLVVWAAGVSSAITAAGLLSGRTPAPELFEELTWSLYERGRAISAADYLLAVIRLQQAARTLGRFQEDYDALLTPTTASPAPELGSFSQGTPDQQMARAVEFVHESPLANLTGQPAVSVPLQWTADGLPVGVHFTGRFGDEAGLLSLAAQLERAQPWAQRLPELRAETSCSR